MLVIVVVVERKGEGNHGVLGAEKNILHHQGARTNFRFP